MFRKAKKKMLKWWRLRDFRIGGFRFLRQERVLPLDARNIRKTAIYVRQIDRIRHLPGAIVECGVWKGRTLLMLAALARNERAVWGFDSFAGFPVMTEHDIKESAERESFKDTSLPMVRKFLEINRVSAHLVEGPFNQTLPTHKQAVGPIALLCLDCDVYDSYRVCLAELYDQVVSGGVILFDEYAGTYERCKWPGAAKAIDEFFLPKRIPIIDGGGKSIVIKP